MKDRITVIGNIANSPEQRRTAAGDTVVNFRLATNQSHYDTRTGKWVEGETNWYKVSAFRALAEHALASLHVGERVIVTGTFRLRQWDNGEKKGTDAEIDADAVGHDLRWGTTVFRRDQSNVDAGRDPGATGAEPSNGNDAGAGDPPVQTWPTPPIAGESQDAANGDHRALVGANADASPAWRTPGVDDDTPY
ncbi:single-stranded DNA-binding protein [Microbacterium invictum]|uniref:Single-stranded DNA-binding protein n=1 Tax=Microbacterium invictum TaxID=515415 RepID=A0AA40SMK2_9MICO|nr:MULTISPECIES: single-stranded DNA-binding protein [Microbacterium]MBB4139000.1 single-strand DNA-binding protein [Microbacterium invictum]